MNRADFDKTVTDTIKATGGLLISKGEEYAGDADRLANFKRNAEKQGTTPLQIWKQYYAKHADSIDTYFQRIHDEAMKMAVVDLYGTHSLAEMQAMSTFALVDDLRARVRRNMPYAIKSIDQQLSEPIEGRFHDIINYCLLGIALLQETRDGAA